MFQNHLHLNHESTAVVFKSYLMSKTPYEDFKNKLFKVSFYFQLDFTLGKWIQMPWSRGAAGNPRPWTWRKLNTQQSRSSALTSGFLWRASISCNKINLVFPTIMDSSSRSIRSSDIFLLVLLLGVPQVPYLNHFDSLSTEIQFLLPVGLWFLNNISALLPTSQFTPLSPPQGDPGGRPNSRSDHTLAHCTGGPARLEKWFGTTSHRRHGYPQQLCFPECSPGKSF